jgi:hypothetical protein
VTGASAGERVPSAVVLAALVLVRGGGHRESWDAADDTKRPSRSYSDESDRRARRLVPNEYCLKHTLAFAGRTRIPTTDVLTGALSLAEHIEHAGTDHSMPEQSPPRRARARPPTESSGHAETINYDDRDR